MAKWRTWNHVTAIEKHHQVKEHLRSTFLSISRVSAYAFSSTHSELMEPQLKPGLQTMRTFEKLVALDVVNFSTQLAILLMDNGRYKSLIARRDEAAQAFLNVLRQ